MNYLNQVNKIIEFSNLEKILKILSIDKKDIYFIGGATRSILNDVYKHSSEQYRPEGQLPTSLGHINLHMPAEIGDTIASEWSEETDHISGGAAIAQSGSALFDSVKNAKSFDTDLISQTMTRGTLAGISSLGNMGKAVFEGADFVTRGIQRRMGQRKIL